MGQYYYLEGAEPIGPLSLQDVYTLIDREVIGSTTLMCREGAAEWQILPSIPELSGKSRAGNAGGSTRTSSTGTKRQRRAHLNLTVIIIACLFAAVALYVTYAISHQTQETTPELDRVLGR